MEIQRFGTDTPWEDLVGYCRVIRHGNNISVSGTTATANGAIVGKNDAYLQAICIFEKIQKAIEQAGGNISGIIRIKMYVVDIKRDWQAIGKAHKQFFDKNRPVATMVEVNALIHPDMLLEVEAEAVITR